MIYGLYLSATGIMTSTHQQDVIANNLANSETSGFKRAMSLVEQRTVESKARQISEDGSSEFDSIGGGHFLAPTMLDFTQGPLEQSDNKFDTAFEGSGFIAVHDEKGELRLTRAGELMINNKGDLITAQGHRVLDTNKSPINLGTFQQQQLSISKKGDIAFGTDRLTTIGLFDVAEPNSLKPDGSNMLRVPEGTELMPAKGHLLSGYTEKSNVEPTTELTRLMEIQRLLEGNANMIKYQDATLSKAVNELGKVG